MNNSPILRGQIDNKVKQYWLVLAVIVCFCGVATIIVIPIIVPLVMFLSGRYLKALSVELFERKLSVKKGILVKVEKSVPLEKITDISMVQGPLMRAFGLFRLNFETAGQSDAGALVSVIGIVGAEQFREQVLAQKDDISVMQKPSDDQSEDKDPLLISVQNIEAMLRDLMNAKKTVKKQDIP